MSDETAKEGMSTRMHPTSSPDKLEDGPLNSSESFRFAINFQRIPDPSIRKKVSKFVKALANPNTDT